MADYSGVGEEMLGNFFDNMMANIAKQPYWTSLARGSAFAMVRDGRMSQEDFYAWLDHDQEEIRQAVRRIDAIKRGSST